MKKLLEKMVEEKVEIRLDDLRSIEIANFLEEHIQEMKAVSPPESKHALDLEGLKRSKQCFYGKEFVRQCSITSN